MIYRIEYHRFVGGHPGETFTSYGAALKVVQAELNALREAAGPWGAPWRRVQEGVGVDMSDVVLRYEHVSWSKHKPERILIVREFAP